jgi:hypothetical protein
MNFEMPVPDPSEFEPEIDPSATIGQSIDEDFAAVKDRIWAKIVEEINRHQA